MKRADKLLVYELEKLAKRAKRKSAKYLAAAEKLLKEGCDEPLELAHRENSRSWYQVQQFAQSRAASIREDSWKL